MTGFKRFVAIDWSGAKSGYGKKLAIAICERGARAPALVPTNKNRTRQDVIDLITEQPPGTLIGFDFSFAPPFVDQGRYLPGESVPGTGPEFWAHVQKVCRQDPDYGARTFVEERYRRHFYLGKADGAKAHYMRWRRCEELFNAHGGGKAACVFDAIGAAQVSKASFSGMRVLSALHGQIPIWPFDAVVAGQSAIVEIYCRAFIQHAGLRGLKIRDAETLNAALAAFGSEPFEAGSSGGLSDDETDVLTTAAGLRALSSERKFWHPNGLSSDVARTEGWTFGVV